MEFHLLDSITTEELDAWLQSTSLEGEHDKKPQQQDLTSSTPTPKQPGTIETCDDNQKRSRSRRPSLDFMDLIEDGYFGVNEQSSTLISAAEISPNASAGGNQEKTQGDDWRLVSDTSISYDASSPSDHRGNDDVTHPQQCLRTVSSSSSSKMSSTSDIVSCDELDECERKATSPSKASIKDKREAEWNDPRRSMPASVSPGPSGSQYSPRLGMPYGSNSSHVAEHENSDHSPPKSHTSNQSHNSALLLSAMEQSQQFQEYMIPRLGDSSKYTAMRETTKSREMLLRMLNGAECSPRSTSPSGNSQTNKARPSIQSNDRRVHNKKTSKRKREVRKYRGKKKHSHRSIKSLVTPPRYQPYYGPNGYSPRKDRFYPMKHTDEIGHGKYAVRPKNFGRFEYDQIKHYDPWNHQDIPISLGDDFDREDSAVRAELQRLQRDQMMEMNQSNQAY